MGIVLDTSAYSAFQKGDKAVQRQLLSADHIFVPITTVGELLFAFAKGSQMAQNISQFNRFIATERVSEVPITRKIAEQYATLKRGQQLLGFSLDDNDLWIAATSHFLQQPLLTLDSDFSRIPDLQLVNLD